MYLLEPAVEIRVAPEAAQPSTIVNTGVSDETLSIVSAIERELKSSPPVELICK
jgi:hypothetical protein